MFNISSYLAKLTNNLKSSELEKDFILQTIKQNTDISFEPTQIEVKNFVLYIKSSMSEKNKIFINKNRILEDLKKFSQLTITDIR